MIAKLAYLTTPGPDRFVLNVQPLGTDEFIQFEISKAHLANILIDGTALALRDSSNRVSANSQTESANVGATGR